MRSIAISIKLVSRSLFMMFNTSLSVSSLLLSSTLCMSEQFRREYCSCWSMLPLKTFDHLVRADNFSFNFFIISFFSSRSFLYSSNLSVINLIDFERSASDCLPLMCVCLFWSTKLLIYLTSFSKFFKQFKEYLYSPHYLNHHWIHLILQSYVKQRWFL